MANIFETNPNAHDFLLTNTTLSTHFPIATKILYASESKTLSQLRADFCLFKQEYYSKPKLRQLFDDGDIIASAINGPSPIICPFQSSGSSSGSSGGDTFASKTTVDDAFPGFLWNEIEVDPDTLIKTLLDLAGDKRVKLTGKIKNFTDLFDTFNSFSGKSGEVLSVKQNETGLESKNIRKEFDFSVPALTWTCNHNYGYKPLFDIIDINGRPRRIVNHEHVSNNLLEIYWVEPTAGTLITR